MIEVSWPYIFLLLPIPLLLSLATSQSKARRSENTIKIAPRLASALHQLDKKPGIAQRLLDSRIWRLILLWVAWIALLVAIAQPTRPENSTAQAASGRAMTVLIDLSTSMERRDFKINDEPVDRLTVVKAIASKFINNRTGDRIGLVLFGSEAFTGSPLSYDLASVNHVLQSSGIGMAGRTTAMGDALGLAIQSLREDPAQEKAIVLLSDGTNNAGTAEPEDAARLAATLGIKIYTIGLGSDASSNEQQQFQSASADLDENTLKTIAIESNGEFFRAHTASELQTIYQKIDELERTDQNAPPLIIKRDLRNIFVLIALLSVLIALLLNAASGWRK